MFERELKEVENQCIKWRRHLHEYPELSNNEYITSDFIEKEIRKIDRELEIERPLPTTLSVRLVGKEKGKKILFRADIDALPIKEETNLVYQSKNDNIMHACGHDGHTAILLSVLKILTNHRDQLKGEILFIFQAGEEIGGARELIKESILDEVDEGYAIHLWPSLEVGKYQLSSGAIMAAGSWFNIEIIGIGGHAGKPHESIDPINATLDIIHSIKAQINRKINPLIANLFSVTYIQSGEANNVIPERLKFGGTIRTLDKKTLIVLKRIINETVISFSQLYDFSYQCEFEIDHLKTDDLPSAPLINNLNLVENLKKELKAKYGEVVEQFPPTLAGEDFSFYSQKIPVAFTIVGCGKGYPLHHPKFSIDEKSLVCGIRVFLTIAEGMIIK